MRKAGALVIGALAITTALLAGGASVQAQSPEEGATSALFVTKLCPAGTGGSDASFNVLVAQNGVGLAADVMACDEVLVVPGLTPGIYNLSELITGPDAANFSTSIACATAIDPFVTPGSSADVAVEAGVDAQCAVVNLFAPGAPSTPEEDATQDGTNNSTHTSSNVTRITGNGLDNTNYESNSNTTSNSQHDDSSDTQNNGNVE